MKKRPSLIPVYYNTKLSKYDTIEIDISNKTTIGRCSDDKKKRILSFAPSQISRTHGHFVISSGDKVEFVDQSKHGTFINGEKKSQAVLEEGDVISFGSIPTNSDLFFGYKFSYKQSNISIRSTKDASQNVNISDFIDENDADKTLLGNLMYNMYLCSICKYLMINPSILPCSHAFCYKCILTLPKHDCPICNQQFTENPSPVFSYHIQQSISQVLFSLPPNSQQEYRDRAREHKQYTDVHGVAPKEAQLTSTPVTSHQSSPVYVSQIDDSEESEDDDDSGDLGGRKSKTIHINQDKNKGDSSNDSSDDDDEDEDSTSSE